MDRSDPRDSARIADELLARERQADELERKAGFAANPALKARRRPWLLVVSLLLALGAGGAYFWQYSTGARGADLLYFTSLYVASPLLLAVVALFGYLRYPRIQL